MDEDLIGTEVWDCDGCLLNPRMRRDILMTAEMYDWWEAGGTSFRWDRAVRDLVETEPNPVETVGDLFGELTGERDFFSRWDFLNYSDKLYEWLKDYIYEAWGDAAYEEDADGDSDPMSEAQGEVFEWLSGLRIEEVLAWRDA